MDPSEKIFELEPWQNEHLGEISVKIPGFNGLGILSFILRNRAGMVLHRNFICFDFNSIDVNKQEIINQNGNSYLVLSCNPDEFTESVWSEKQWNVQGSRKVNGAGHGQFTYTFQISNDYKTDNIESGILRIELSSKRLMGKDRDEEHEGSSDYMRGGGLHDPSKNPNSYPMTDTYRNPSVVRIIINGINAGEVFLPDDPCDHQGILSWHNQEKDGTLDEAGTYGYLTDIVIPAKVLEKIHNLKTIEVCLEANESISGGLAVYGKRSGKYPVNPMIIFQLKN
jgi:hypothetical protein